MESEECSVCLHDPGFEVDVNVVADTAAMYDVYLGRRTLHSAVLDESVMITGRFDMVRAVPRWFTWSDFAPAVRSAMART